MKRWLAGALVLALAGAATAAVLADLGSNAPLVPTARARRGAVHVLVHAKGDLRALRSVPLMVPPIGGPVTIIELVANGTAVKGGDIIVAFDPSEQEFALEQATFDLQLADQELAKAEAEAAAQGADDEVSLLKARFEARRAELDASTDELVGAVLAAQHKLLFDEARDRLSQLEVDVKSRREASTASRAVLRERRMKAQVAVEVARRNIQNLQIRAPFDGFVTLRMNTMAFGGVVFSGAVMPEYRVGDTANPGQLVGDLIDTSRVEITAKLPEYERANVAAGQSVRISVDAVPGADLQGTVRSASGVASRQMFGGGTRQYDIAIDVAGDTSRIRPGVTAELAIACQTYDDALHVPRRRSSKWRANGRSTCARRQASRRARSRSWPSPRARRWSRGSSRTPKSR